MSYQAMRDLYESDLDRITMCVREQGQIFANDGRADIAALGRATVTGSSMDIDAVTMAVCTGPNWQDLADDQALLSAVQAVWPTVAAALYPQA